MTGLFARYVRGYYEHLSRMVKYVEKKAHTVFLWPGRVDSNELALHLFRSHKRDGTVSVALITLLKK